MRKVVFLVCCLLALTRPSTVRAQSDFFFSVYGGATNLWSSVYLQIPANLINYCISAALDEEEVSGGALRFDVFRIKNDGEKVKVDRGHYWRARSKDMFSNVQYGLKFGWQPELSPFGVYVSCAYQFDKFSAQLDPSTDQWNRYKVNSLRPGIGVRVAPFMTLLEDCGWTPLLELGTSYNYYFGGSAPYGNDKEQFNSGMISTFAIGVRSGGGYSITGGVELSHYSMFNQDFTPDGLTYPYRDVESSKLTIFLSVSHDF